MSLRTIHLVVDGMMCQRNCGSSVATALSTTMEGAVEAKADFATKSAWVRTSSSLDQDQIAVDIVDAIGFEARPAVHLHVIGMMCQKNCGTTVANALKALSDVHDATALFDESRAIVALHPGVKVADVLPQLLEAVEVVGFDASFIPDIQTYLDDNATQSSRNQESQNDPLSESSLTSLLPKMNDVEIDEAKSAVTLVLGVGGMSCAVCTGRVERCLRETPGVVDATVVLSTQRALVELLANAQRDKTALDCCNAVQKAGYSCHIMAQSHDLRKDARQLERARQEEEAYWLALFVFSSLLTIPMVILATGVITFAPSHVPIGNLWVVCILSTLVQLVVGKRYYIAAWKGWAHGRFLGMDFLVVLGTTSSYVYSMALFMEQLWTGLPTELEPSFMASAMLLTFVTLGKYLESYARGKTADAVHKLMELQPTCASRVLGFVVDEKSHKVLDISALNTEEVPISGIQPGDHVRVLPGGSIPADGVLVAISSRGAGGTQVQEAFIDESAFSGEPFPVSKRIGDPVYGSTVNHLSALVVRVTASGSDTFLSKIVRLVEDAQRHKAPIQAYADKLASVFAPAVVFVASITFVGWMVFGNGITVGERFNIALMSSIAVIVVACPCALGLATPTAVMVGTGVGATQGVLIKGGAVLEQMHTVDTVVFDKTGTLTCGKATLSDRIEYFEEADEILKQHLPSRIPEDMVTLWLAVCAEAQSEHPLAQAIVNAAKEAWGKEGEECDLTGYKEGVRVDNFCVHPGRGVECRVSKPEWGRRVIRIGKKEWCKEPLDSAPVNDDGAAATDDADLLRRQGKIAIYLSILEEGSISRRVIAVFGVVDAVKPEAASTVAALQKSGVDVWMCTGDDIITALAVGRSIGIPDSNICAGVTPEGKADLVTRLQNQAFSGSQAPLRKNARPTRSHRGNVAMVADGVNDSIALARSDVGIAIGAGREIALEAADVVLVRSNLHDVVVAFHLSSVVFRRILLNFVLALCYNIIAVPFAAGLFDPITDFHLPPALAGFMMACSSISVVSSSLLLRRYQRPIVTEDGDLEVEKGWLELATHFVGLHRIALGRGYEGCETDNPGDIV